MDCKFVERSISDYLSGELPAQQVLELEGHLRACPECQAMLEDLQKTVAACRSLPNFEAREDLWYSLRRRIPIIAAGNAEQGRGTTGSADVVVQLQRRVTVYRRVALAAVAMAVLSVSLWVGQFLYAPEMNPDGASAPTELAALEIRKAELHYQNAIDSLTPILEVAKADWNPQVRTIVEQNLRTIDDSILECRKAVRRDPRNLEAGTYLLAAYRKKVDLIRSVLDQASSGS